MSQQPQPTSAAQLVSNKDHDTTTTAPEEAQAPEATLPPSTSNTVSCPNHTVPCPNHTVRAVVNPYLRPPKKRVSLGEEDADSATVSRPPPPVAVPQHIAATPVPAEPPTEPPVVVAQENPTSTASERLPSCNVSYQSAEVLRVEEVATHNVLYRNRSIRFTGVVRHRHVGRDGTFCIYIVGSALAGGGTKQNHPRRRHSGSFPKTPVSQHSKASTTTSVYKTPGPRPSLVRKSLLGTKSSFKTPRRSLLLTSRKRSLGGERRVSASPLDLLWACLNQDETSIVVLVPSHQASMPVNDCFVGNLVMVLGELRPVDGSDPTVPPFLTSLLERMEKESSPTRQAPTYVQARILQNVNGTDLRLHEEALELRREYLKKQPPFPTDGPLRPGCGPPPYVQDGPSTSTIDLQSTTK